jgi:UDP:flavonoid glycosyltransferase YjiC (YdhE family)
MRVLAACSLGGAGHLQPLLPLLDAARSSGHETLVVGPPALAPLVAETGHEFAAGGEPPEAAIAPIREQLPTAPEDEAARLGNCELFGGLATTAMLTPVRDLVRAWLPDLMLRDPCEYASAVVAAEAGITHAQVGIGLADGEWRSIAIAAPALEEHRPGLVDALRRAPYVTRFPASLDPSPFPDTRRFRQPVPASARPLPRWWGQSSAPLVYLSFGTVLGHMSIAGDVYRTALRAVERIDARVLLTVGRQFDISTLDDQPAHIHIEPWVDQTDVLPEAAVVVCHGGSGTTFGALAAGVPLVMVPLFADQFANGPKIVAAGAGALVDRGRDDTGLRLPLTESHASRITEAIEAVLASPSCREQARRLGDEMASAPTADAVLETLLDELRPTPFQPYRG